VTDVQLFLAVGLPTFTVLIGILLNNYRLNDIKELLRAEIQSVRAETQSVRSDMRGEIQAVRSDVRAGFAELRVLIERNSEVMMKLSEHEYSPGRG
jgi:hypothetical protein